MGNHYHLILWFDERCPLSCKELMRRASFIYPKTLLKGWRRANWARFEERIFDVSEYMRNLQAAFAHWFNQTFGRRGRFWANRFKSTLLENEKQVRDCLLYVELNPVRARIAVRPEERIGQGTIEKRLLIYTTIIYGFGSSFVSACLPANSSYPPEDEVLAAITTCLIENSASPGR
jgi:hypothetical protein